MHKILTPEEFVNVLQSLKIDSPALKEWFIFQNHSHFIVWLYVALYRINNKMIYYLTIFQKIDDDFGVIHVS
jgi:hypothetical protein